MKIPALVAAAGGSTRCPEGKLTKLWRGKPLLCWLLDTLEQHPQVGKVVILTGRHHAEVHALAGGRPEFEVYHNPDWSEGLSSTLKLGESYVPRGSGFLVALGDTPLFSAHTLSRVIPETEQEQTIRVPLYKGKTGHPVFFPEWVRDDWAALSGDCGAKPLFARWPNRVTTLLVDDPGVARDFDQARDFEVAVL